MPAETLLHSNTTTDIDFVLGSYATGHNIDIGLAITPSANEVVTAFEFKRSSVVGSPTGTWEFRIETDSSGHPSGTLVNANATVTVTPPGLNSSVKGSFPAPINISAGVKYWFVVYVAETGTNYWNIPTASTGGPASSLGQRDNYTTWSIYSNYNYWYKVYGYLPVKFLKLNVGGYNIAAIDSTGLSLATGKTYQINGVNLAVSDISSLLTETATGIGIRNASPNCDLQIHNTGAAVRLQLTCSPGSGGSNGINIIQTTTVATILSYENVPLTFQTNATEYIRIFATGVVNIGATSTVPPKSALLGVNGDLAFYDTTHGSIYKSANGHYWRLTVSDAGAAVITDLGT
jgi:hypothetical protein